MDAIDRTICEMLQRDGQATAVELGRAAGVPSSTANDRVRRLAGHGVIDGWSARLDPAKVGLNVLAFVFVLLEKPGDTAPFVRAMRALDCVQECHHITGEWSDLLKIRTASIAQLEQVINGKIKACRGVVRTLTMIALSSPKETALLPLGHLTEPEA
jgi:Lrp/AsnC family transcriptional regulator, leucine-responsive regulatory protein